MRRRFSPAASSTSPAPTARFTPSSRNRLPMRRGTRNFNLFRSSSLAYNPQSTTERIRLPEPAPSPERYALAVITDGEQLFPEVRKHLGAQFRTTLASTEDEIK